MAKAPPPKNLFKRAQVTLSLLKHFPRTARLVWASSRGFAILLVASLLGASFVPAATAWVGKLIVDAVVAAAKTGEAAAQARVLMLVGLELGLMVLSTVMARIQGLLRQLLGASLGKHVNTLILEKALTLEMRHFEDADFYDKMQNARREASSRPLSMVLQLVSMLQSTLTLGSFAFIL